VIQFRRVVETLTFLAFPLIVAAQTDNSFVYQIFVRSFADTPSDSAPSGRGETGDIRGILENLDYLNDGKPATDADLEVGILWLLPIFPSPTYHGYDVTDYRAVNPDYGTIQDLRRLLDAAHKRGMRVILDLPVNHTSRQHAWFKQAVNDPASGFRKFYHFSSADQPAPPGVWHLATGTGGKSVRYLGVFSSEMPDLNFDEPQVRTEVKAIARFWLDQGVDGFRLDAAKHIYGTSLNDVSESVILRNNDWWREFSDFVYGVKPNAVIVGEVLGDPEMLRRHAWGNDALVDEPFMKAARSRMAFPGADFLTNWASFLRRCREVNKEAHARPGSPARSEPFQPFTYLASHDENPRLASHLEDMKHRGMQATVDQAYRLGMYLLTSMSKYAILYNGDELMQPGIKWNGDPRDKGGDGSGIYDETLREPFPWGKSGSRPPQTGWFAARFDRPDDGISVEEENAPASMLSLVRALTNLRTQHPSWANGDIGTILNDSPEWMVFERVSGRDRYLVLLNSTGSGREYEFHSAWHPDYAGAQLLFWSDGNRKEWKNESKAGKRIASSVFVPPWGMVLLRQPSVGR
jgi:alpha-amylase